MPTGRVSAARLERTQSDRSRLVPCNRLSQDCHSSTSFVPPHQQQQQHLFEPNPKSRSSSQVSTPNTPGLCAASTDISDSTEGIEPCYGLAAAAAAAGEAKAALSAENSNSNAAIERAEAATQLQTDGQQQQQQQEEGEQFQTEVQIDINDAPHSCTASSSTGDQQQQPPCAWHEVIAFALPMLATLAADPLASLVDTAFVGHLGAAQLAGVGMAINIFSSITRLFNAPLLAVTTSAVAAAAAESDCDSKGNHTAAAEAGNRSGTLDKPETLGTVPSRSAACTVRSNTLDSVGSLPKPFASDQNLASDADAVVQCSDAVMDIESPVAPTAAEAAAAMKNTTSMMLDELVCRTEDESTDAKSALDDLTQPLLGSSSSSKREHSKLSAAVSAAIILALSFSLVEVIVLAGNCSSLVSLWGAPAGSPLNTPTRQFLLLRGLAAPVTVLLLVMQGVFRGLQDAKTPFYATLACNALNIALEPPFIFKPLHLGVQGSALATALAQTVPLVALLVVLQRRYKLRFRGLDMTQLGAMFAPTGFLLLRTISISAVFATATSLVARAGPLAAAAHQVAFQIWMATSLLADSLAVASQTIIARSVAANNLTYARKVAGTSVTMALALGCVLSVMLGAAMHALPGLFTQDKAVLSLAKQLMPIVAFTQPINALAFVLDGVLYGAGGFKFASGIMLLCATPSLGLMFAGQVLDGPQRQHKIAPNQLPYTLGNEALELGFGSSRAFSTQVKPHSGRVLQAPKRQYGSTVAGQLSYAGGTLTEWTGMQSSNEPNNYLTNMTASGAFSSSSRSGFRVLPSIWQVSVVDVLQGFVAQPSMQGYNSLYSQHSGLGFSTSHQEASTVAAAAAAAHSNIPSLSNTNSAGTFPAAAAASLPMLQDSSSSAMQVSSHVPMPAAVYWVWAGMVMLMIMRAATILLPLACRCYPFSCLFKDLRENRQQQQQQQHQDVRSDHIQTDLRQPSSLSMRSLSSLLAPARMWAWLGRGSFFAAGPAAAAAVKDPLNYPTDDLASCKRQRSSCSGFNAGASDQHDDARIPLLPKEGKFHCDESEVLAVDHAATKSSYKLAAVADEQFLQGACAGIPITKLSEVHSDISEVDDSLLVVVCGGGGSSSGSGRSSLASSSSSTEVLGSSLHEQ